MSSEAQGGATNRLGRIAIICNRLIELENKVQRSTILITKGDDYLYKLDLVNVK